MRTYGQVIIDISNQAYLRALSLSGKHHTDKDMMAFIKDVGSEVEIYLKEAVYINQRNRDTFANLIDGLTAQGIPDNIVNTLHNLRKTYNSAKHDPSFVIETPEVIKILKSTKETLDEMQKFNLGIMNNSVVVNYKRNLWIAGWDHFHTGEIEIHIFLPYDGDRLFPPAVDMFNIHYSGWDEIVAKFTSSGDLFMGKDYLPERIYRTMSSEGEFIEAGLFDGDYRELLIELTKYVDSKTEEQLLSFLRRSEDIYAMYSAVQFSACDILKDGRYIGNVEELSEHIYRYCEYKYAAPKNSKILMNLVPRIIKLLFQLKPEHRSGLEGPLFLSEEEFEKHRSSSYYVDNDLGWLLTNNGELISKL